MTVSELVTLGETMALMSSPRIGRLRHASELKVGAAGSESNLAIGFQRLGGTATWIGRVGRDEFGAMVTETIRATGVQTVAIQDPTQPTGLMFKERRTADLVRVQYYREQSAGSRLSPEDLGDHIRPGVVVLHVSGITAAISSTARETVMCAIRRARAAGAAVSVDLNHRTALWTDQQAGSVLPELIESADVVFATHEEARLVADGSEPKALARRILQLGPTEVIIKLGDQGCVCATPDQVSVVPALKVPVVDSVGAGDAFAAGYLFELTRNKPIAQRLATATRTGAYAVTLDGDWEGAPTYGELAHLDELSGTVLR